MRTNGIDEPVRRRSFFPKLFFIVAIVLAVVVLLIRGTMIPEKILYSPTFVESICAQFRINDDDDFCANPETQDFFSLNSAIERWFPIGTTTYSELLPFIQNVDSESDCFIAPSQVASYDYCPPPEECSGELYCMIEIVPEFEIGIVFERESSHVMEYKVQRPPEDYSRFRR